jgi:TRAP-type C4-dicarboxylate transport system permease small subunit
MMLMITVDVTGRYVFASPIPGTLEFTEFLMVFVVFFSLPYVQLKKRHICVELVTQRLPQKVADGLAIVTLLVAALFFGLMAWQSWLSATSAFEYREASEGLIQIPIYPPKFAIPFGSVIMVIQLLRDAGDRLRHLVSPE